MATSPKATSSLSALKLIAATIVATTDPVVLRRNAMVVRLQEQLALCQDPNFKKVLKHRGKEDTQHRVASWWIENADGTAIFSLKFQFKNLEIAKGLTGIV